MEKRITVPVWVSLAMILHFIVIIIEIAPIVDAPTTWYVDDVPGSGGPGDPPEDFTSIQDAINAAQPGDTIFVYNGTYYENVVVNETINLIGEDRNNTIIDGGGIGQVVDVKSDWVNISGFTISGSEAWGSGINLYNVHNCCVKDNSFTNNNNGIHLAYSTNNKLYNNKMENCGIAIPYPGGDMITLTTQEIPTNNTVNGKPLYYYKNANMNNKTVPLNAGQVILGNVTWLKIENLNVSNGINGIFIGYSSCIYIANNTCNSHNDSGIYIKDSNNNTIVNNTCNSNRAHGILLISHSNNNLIDNNTCINNTLTKGAGIALSASSNKNRIINNTCIYNYRGINQDFSNHNIIVKNNCSNNLQIGIYHTSSGYNIIENNLFLSNGEYGIYFDSKGSVHNTIKNNNCSNNKYGIMFWTKVENNTIMENNISNNDYGIYLTLSSNYNLITNNIVSSNNYYGICLFSSSNLNNIIGNTVFSNSDYGFYINGSSNNNIYHNNIINNTVQAYDDTDNGNLWDNGYPTGGNYWSDFDEPNEGAYDDYKGSDQNVLGGDGIVDNGTIVGGGKNPYVIDADSQDNYPLMEPIENYTILKQGWNLISLPLIQEDQNLIKVLEMIDGYYDTVEWYNISDANDPWKIYNVNKPFGIDLTRINEKMGFWIYITPLGGAILLHNGAQPTSNQTIPLRPGWNMVGYPSLTSYNRTDGLNNLTFGTHVDSIWTYNSGTHRWKEIGLSDYFKPGQGYWIHAKLKCEWEIPL